MRFCVAIFMAAGLVTWTSAGDPREQPPAPPAPPRAEAQPATPADHPAAKAGDDLAQQEQVARADATVALTRLELVLARKALRDRRFEEAARKALRALALLKQVPPGMDTSEYELQSEGILARAAHAGVKIEALRRATNDANGQSSPPAGANPQLDANAQEREQLRYQGALADAYKDSEAQALIDVDESRLIPDKEITYPPDWPEKMKRRERYAGGMIARTPSRIDQDGREWYTAVYDIHDLIYVPPDFTAPEFNPIFAQRDAEDRAALRWGSQIFRGWPEDLAAGIPLLRFFGGVNDWEFRGPKYSVERQKYIVDLIKAFTEAPEGGPQIIALPP